MIRIVVALSSKLTIKEWLNETCFLIPFTQCWQCEIKQFGNEEISFNEARAEWRGGEGGGWSLQVTICPSLANQHDQSIYITVWSLKGTLQDTRYWTDAKWLEYVGTYSLFGQPTEWEHKIKPIRPEIALTFSYVYKISEVSLKCVSKN